MSYTYLQEREAGFWEECYSDTPQFALWKLNPIAEKSCCSASATESCQNSQFGTTCEPSTDGHGEDSLTLSAEGSRVRTSVVPEKEQELPESEADSGQRWHGLYLKLDQDSHLWKIPDTLPGEDFTLFCETFPTWGIVSNGECFAVTTPADFTEEAEYSCWPTPTKSDARNWVSTFVSLRNPKLSGRQPAEIHPNLHETLMMWPTDWTDCLPLEMDKFQQWLNSHGKF